MSITLKKIKTLSLFTGAGGLDIGFHKAGFESVACVEIEAAYCETLRKNIKDGNLFSSSTVVHNEDVRLFDASQYVDKGIDCIIGGPPCQSFSAAGRRSGGVAGTNDDRGQLFKTYCEILDVIKPKVFVFENVYGLTGANGGDALRDIVAEFSKHGYELNYRILDAADYGVPQHRERLIMVGYKSGNFSFPMPTHGPDSNSELGLVSCEDAISDIQDPNEDYHDGLGGLYGHLLPEVPEGLNYSFFTAEMGHPHPVFAWRSKFHDLLYKADSKRPSRTLKAKPGKFTGPFHWKNRHFNLNELKRIQSFPDHYEIVGSPKRCMEQIGNSVPPKLATAIADSVKEQLFDSKKTTSVPLIPKDFVSTARKRQRERTVLYKEIAKKEIELQYGTIFDTNHGYLGSDSYFSIYKGKFSRVESVRVPNEDGYFFIDIKKISRNLAVKLEEHNTDIPNLIEGTIKVTGLSKYLPDYDELCLSFNISSLDNIFHVWKEVEEILTRRSKFFTLIDIYGHYANRGDVVDIRTEVSSDVVNTNLLKIINYISSTENCGKNTTIQMFLSANDIKQSDFDDIFTTLRNMRFDIRNSITHPILGDDGLLCTYPFPLLSKKALVVSKAVLVDKDVEKAS